MSESTSTDDSRDLEPSLSLEDGSREEPASEEVIEEPSNGSREDEDIYSESKSEKKVEVEVKYEKDGYNFKGDVQKQIDEDFLGAEIDSFWDLDLIEYDGDDKNFIKARDIAKEARGAIDQEIDVIDFERKPMASLGKCPACGNVSLVAFTVQLSSGDEGMTTFKECTVCPWRSKQR